MTDEDFENLVLGLADKLLVTFGEHATIGGQPNALLFGLACAHVIGSNLSLMPPNIAQRAMQMTTARMVEAYRLGSEHGCVQ